MQKKPVSLPSDIDSYVKKIMLFRVEIEKDLIWLLDQRLFLAHDLTPKFNKVVLISSLNICHKNNFTETE